MQFLEKAPQVKDLNSVFALRVKEEKNHTPFLFLWLPDITNVALCNHSYLNVVQFLCFCYFLLPFIITYLCFYTFVKYKTLLFQTTCLGFFFLPNLE